MASRPSNASSSRPGASPAPQRPQPSSNTRVIDTVAGRILCLADIRGNITSLNQLAADNNAKAIIHTGDFGFFENTSLDRINERTLRHLVLYSPLIQTPQRNQLLAPENSIATLRSAIATSPTPLLSQFPALLSGQLKLNVPVYTVWGACEDVAILEKFRTGEYNIENLSIVDEATSRCLEVGGVKLRLLGLGGALVPHKMFDNGEGRATIAGGQGTMWVTALQIGELVDTAQRVYDQSETRLLVTHASPGREGLISQLALVLKADLTISAGLHFRYGSSYNEFSVQPDMEAFRQKLLNSKENFDKLWETVKPQVDAVMDDHQRMLLEKALMVIDRVPPPPPTGPSNNTGAGEEPAWKNCWNWNLCDATFGHLILDVKEGRISSEMKSQGFNYAYRKNATAVAPPAAATPATAGSHLPPSQTPGGGNSARQTQTSSPAPPFQSTPANKPVVATAAQSSSGTASSSPRGTNVRLPTDTPPTKVNGSTSTPESTTPGGDKGSKKKTKKDKDRERQDKEGSGSVDLKDKNSNTADSGPSPKPRSQLVSPTPGKASPAVEVEVRPSQDTGPRSPAMASDSAGARTPTTRRPPRNPWTLFVNRLPLPFTEDEIREFFGEAKTGITSVKWTTDQQKRQKPTAFVEFGDEEAMNAGLSKHAETLRDATPRVVIAEDRGSYYDNNGPSNRGGSMRGRGRGAFGRGGIAAAVAAAAGPSARPIGRAANGDAPGGGGKRGSFSKKGEAAKETAPQAGA